MDFTTHEVTRRAAFNLGGGRERLQPRFNEGDGVYMKDSSDRVRVSNLIITKSSFNIEKASWEYSVKENSPQGLVWPDPVLERNSRKGRVFQAATTGSSINQDPIPRPQTPENVPQEIIPEDSNPVSVGRESIRVAIESIHRFVATLESIRPPDQGHGQVESETTATIRPPNRGTTIEGGNFIPNTLGSYQPALNAVTEQASSSLLGFGPRDVKTCTWFTISFCVCVLIGAIISIWYTIWRGDAGSGFTIGAFFTTAGCAVVNKLHKSHKDSGGCNCISPSFQTGSSGG